MRVPKKTPAQIQPLRISHILTPWVSKHVAEERQRQQGPVERGQRREPKPRADGERRQPHADRHDDRGGDHQRPTGPALEERDAVGADDVDDERLREQRFDEPAGLEQRVLCIRPRPCHVPAAEDVEHHQVRRVVEDRTARADEEDEAGDLAHVPGTRLGDLLGVDVVGGDRHLREIVEQIVGQDLDRHHRQERHERRWRPAR